MSFEILEIFITVCNNLSEKNSIMVCQCKYFIAQDNVVFRRSILYMVLSIQDIIQLLTLVIGHDVMLTREY